MGERGDDLTPDGAAERAAVATCLRHLACGYGLLPAEWAACVRLLQRPIAGATAADLAAAQKILVRSARRRLVDRARDRASRLSVRLAARDSAADPHGDGPATGTGAGR